jgi:hypothetical protein
MSETEDEAISRICKRKGDLRGRVYTILAVVTVVVVLVSL